ncbi:MAG: hypothetical protein H0W76_13335 [Pyrinomonadaceae bacterium]|nr:hypothetical protein [Pyrinomonadaceae bacterium]
MKQDNHSAKDGHSKVPSFAGAGISVKDSASGFGSNAQTQAREVGDDPDADIILEEEIDLAEENKRGRSRAAKFLILFLGVSLLVFAAAGAWWLTMTDGGRKERQVNHNERAAREDAGSATAPTDEQITQAAIERMRQEARGTTGAQQSPQVTSEFPPVVQPGTGSRVPQPGEGTPVVQPGIATTIDQATNTIGTRNDPARANQSSTSDADPAFSTRGANMPSRPASQPNKQESVTFSEDTFAPAALAQLMRPASAIAPIEAVSPATASTRTASFTAPTKPPFGAMLPVRALGAIYSLRSGSLARFELTRDVAGQGWAMRRGTTLVATLRGAQHDRAFLSLVGFIDPASGRLVKLGGDVLGTDAGAGLPGKRRRLDSRFARVLGQTVSGAVGITQSVLGSRGGGTTVIMPRASSVYGPELAALGGTAQRREFVEVASDTRGFVMITDLPTSIKGVDALTEMPSDELTALFDESASAASLSEAELADLFTNSSPEQIREALPRMTPQMRRVAESFLRQSEK